MAETQEPEMYVRLLDGLKQASGSAHQLAHARRDPRWLQVRDILEAIRDKASKLAVRSALPRTEVLAALDRRKMSRA